jgi:hypothetical protein
LEKIPLLNFEQCLKSLENLITDLDSYMFTCSAWVDTLDEIPFHLNQDEAAAINIYTREWTVRSESLYFVMNEALRTADRKKIEPFFPFMKLLFTAISKLPTYISPSLSLWRGVNADISKNYKKGKKYIWWGFSSCTTDMEIMRQFLENDNYSSSSKVIFNIHFISHSVNIQDFSLFKQECEVLLLPARYLEVRFSFCIVIYVF